MSLLVAIAFGICFFATPFAVIASAGGGVPASVPISLALFTILLGMWHTLLDIAEIFAARGRSENSTSKSQSQPLQNTARFTPLASPPCAICGCPIDGPQPQAVQPGPGPGPQLATPPQRPAGWKPPASFR